MCLDNFGNLVIRQMALMSQLLQVKDLGLPNLLCCIKYHVHTCLNARFSHLPTRVHVFFLCCIYIIKVAGTLDSASGTVQ